LTVVGAVASISSRLWDSSGDTVFRIARLWSRLTLLAGGVRLHVTMKEPLDPKRSYVFVSNHLSSADIWAHLLTVPLLFRFIAKKQLGKIPLFGWAMIAGRFILIDRKNALAARRSIDEAANRVRKGCSVLIYPEGTRSTDGKLGLFKKGAFHLAFNAGAPIVPMSIKGSDAVMPKGRFLLRPGDVHIEIGAPLETQGLDESARDRVRHEIRARIGVMAGQPLAPEPKF
jgi:1-acyl-sn-glycerol-3-phosphate acyltransferase